MSGGTVLTPGESLSVMTLAEYPIDARRLGFAAAWFELAGMIRSDSNHTWGYIPEMDPDPEEYLASVRLAGALATQLLTRPGLNDIDAELAFVRVATTEPDSTYGGLHVDTSPGILHHRDPRFPAATHRIVRLLCNADNEHPRTVEYVPITRTALGEQGVEISTEEYEILDGRLPTDTPRLTIAVPPRTDHSIYVLRFDADQVVHAGRTDRRGHFLISWGAYVSL